MHNAIASSFHVFLRDENRSDNGDQDFMAYNIVTHKKRFSTLIMCYSDN